jgi:glycosyltransferase involved in cell wall biosynthesis
MSCVDVIVPCYKYAHYLRQCVESVLAQSHCDFRVLIIDDCSPDHTEEVAQALVAQDGRVAYRRHESNCGHIATYNEGLAWAERDYVLLLSADDFLTPGALERAVRLLDENPKVGMVHGDAIVFSSDRPVPEPRAISDSWAYEIINGSDQILRTCAEGYNLIATPTVVARNSIQKRIGGYRVDLPHTGDMEMWLRLALHGSVGYIKADQAYYRKHISNMHKQYNTSYIKDWSIQLATFDYFFDNHADHVICSATVRAETHRQIATLAFWTASRAFDRGAAEECNAYLSFALEADPELIACPHFSRFRIKRALGRRVCNLLEPVWSQFWGTWRLLKNERNNLLKGAAR